MDAVRRFLDGDIFYSFKRSPLVMLAALLVFAYVVAALFAPGVAPHNPFAWFGGLGGSGTPL